MTANDDEATRNEAVDAGCIGYLRKPFARQVLLNAIGKAVAYPRYRKRWRTPAAWTSKVRTSAFRSVSGKISRIFLDNFPIGPARALRRAADDFVNHDGVERAVSHQGVRNRQNRRAMLHDQRLGLGKVR